MSLKQLLSVSRPRFWIYLLGPYSIGYMANIQTDSLIWLAILWGLFFTFPANLFLYGVNDICDWETDKLNPKKTGYELSVQPEYRKQLIAIIVAFLMPALVLSFYSNSSLVIALTIFLLLGLFYSAPPIRAKTKPFLDALSNVLYVMPALVGYFLAGQATLNWYLLIAAGLWTSAMHAYSAIPDISPDSDAKISTIATFLGKNRTLVFCTLCYLSSALLAGSQIGTVAYILGLIYLILMRVSFQQKTDEDLFRIYRYFPTINTVSGFVLFIYVVIVQLS
jgi:4-hydroxybenzoate polyprenyltransferase